MEDPGSSLIPWEDAELCMLTWFSTISCDKERKMQRVLQSALCWSPSVKDTCGQVNTASAVIWFFITSVCLMCSARTPKQCHAAGLSQQPWKAAWRALKVIGPFLIHSRMTPVLSALWTMHQALGIWAVEVGVSLEPHTLIVSTVLFPVQKQHLRVSTSLMMKPL